jgi:NAD+ dependent glucose-6-phosphate dehydrogenase
MNIVVTGASGHLGRKLANHLVAAGHRVTGIDINPSADSSFPIHAADLSQFNENWVRLLARQDVIVHLAADRAPDADWSSVVPNNIDSVLNLHEAARVQNVPRIVFASSNWVLGGYRFSKDSLSADTPPRPVNPYGMSKLMGERIGAHFAAVHGTTVIAVRIGWTQWTHGNQPGPHMAMGRWGQLMWLSDSDFLEGMSAAATAPAEGFQVVNLMSKNPGMRWSLLETKKAIGFAPRDGAPARLTAQVRLKEAGAWLKQVGVPRLMALLTGGDW